MMSGWTSAPRSSWDSDRPGTTARPAAHHPLPAAGDHLVSIIFGQLPELRLGPLELSLVVGVILVANAGISTLLERRGFGPGPAVRQFVVTGLLNLVITVVLVLLLPGGSVDIGRTTFMLFGITLLVTLYDRYHPEYRARFAPGQANS